LIDEDRKEQLHLDLIRERIDGADAQILRGDYVDYDAGTLDDPVKDICDRGMNRLADERRRKHNENLYLSAFI
jgi:hypothetical protein